MRNDTVNVPAGIQPGQALAPRGGALRTFGGLALTKPAVSAVLRGPSSRSGVMIAPLGAWYRGEIPLFQDFAVVQLVAGDDEGQRTHGDFILIGASAAKPSLFAKRVEQR